MSLRDDIYLRAPVPVQQALVALFGVGWYRQRFGGRFAEYVREIEGRDRWTREQFATLETALLTRLLEAASRSTYYQACFGAAGITPAMPPREALAKLPLLEKQVLRARARDLLTAERLPRGVHVFKSSGTTGTPTEIYFSRDFHRTVQAFYEVRNRNWAGVTYRSRRAMFGVRKVARAADRNPPFWRFSPIERLAYCSIYHLSDELMPHYVAFLNEYQPELVMGYPSALATLARFSIGAGLPMAPATAVITTSETVTADTRAALETAWGCKVFDQYGAVEACSFATQCAFGRYHVSSDFGIVEILRPDGSACALGEPGEIVCTGLQNTLQPLIRYRIGDVAAWAADQSCACGRSLPIIEGIDGRVEDMCFTEDGRAVLRFDTVFKGVASIREAQVVQEAIGRFTIRVVADETFDQADRAKLVSNMALHVGRVSTSVEVVPSIARTPAGKFRAVICKLPPEQRGSRVTH